MNSFVKTRQVAIGCITILGFGTLIVDQIKVRMIPYSGFYRRLVKTVEQQTKMIQGKEHLNQQGKIVTKDYKKQVQQLLCSKKQALNYTKQTSNKIRAIQNLISENQTWNHLYSTVFNAIGALIVPQLYLASMSLYFGVNILHLLFEVNIAKNGKQDSLKIKFKQLSSIYVVILPFTIAGLLLNNIFKGGSLFKQLRQTKQIAKIK